MSTQKSRQPHVVKSTQSLYGSPALSVQPNLSCLLEAKPSRRPNKVFLVKTSKWIPPRLVVKL